MNSSENDSIKERKGTRGSAGSLYLDDIVWELLEKKASELRRSMSWMANESIRHDFGLPPGDRK